MIKARALTQAEQDTLEAVLDHTSIASILDALALIAREKADHIRTNWQDDSLARSWDKDAHRLEQCANLVSSF